jgi:hypothetical protein
MWDKNFLEFMAIGMLGGIMGVIVLLNLVYLLENVRNY